MTDTCEAGLRRFPHPPAPPEGEASALGSTGAVTSAAPRVRFAWVAQVIAALLAGYVQLLVRTCRFDGELSREHVVLAFWHEANLTGMAAALMKRGDLPHASFSTRGFRGIVITRTLERLGILVLPLPPEEDRAAARSLSLAMSRLAAAGYSLAVTPDGPFGPARVAKPGALFIARAAGLPILPLAPGARPAMRIRRRWDRHIVPLPFGRVWVLAGDPIAVDVRAPIRRADIEALTAELARLAERNDALTR